MAAARSAVPTVLSTLSHLHRFRSGLPAAGHGQISVLAAVAVGLRVADREPRAVLHAGAGAVQVSDALVGRGARRGTITAVAAAATVRFNIFSAYSSRLRSAVSSVSAKAIATASRTA